VSAIQRFIRAIEPHPGEHFKDKIIAISLALVVWFAVNNEDSVDQIFQLVPVEVVNLSDELAPAADVQDTLTVRVRGPQRDLERLSSGLLSPEIDLTNARTGENVFRLQEEDLPALPPGVSVVRIDPAQITITLEEKVEIYVPVGPVTSGEPAAGYEVIGRSTEPSTALISGPRSLIEAQERIDTATVDVGGRTASFNQAVTLVPSSRLITVASERTVDLRIDIVEESINEQFDGVQVVVVNNRYQVTVNPQTLGVVLSGPPSVLAQLEVAQMSMVIDAADLDPNADDYLVEPEVQFAQTELSALVEVVALYPQRRINVHVFQQPARQ